MDSSNRYLLLPAAYGEFTLDAENLPGKFGGRNVSKDICDVARDIGTVDQGQWGIPRAADDDLALVKFPAPGSTFFD